MTNDILKRLFALALVILSACQSGEQGEQNENAALERELDSVSQELVETRQALMDSQQVKALLDSIDANRRIVVTPMGGETESQTNLNRLSDINEYVKDINLKMDQMEKSIKYVNSMATSILKLQADVEMRTQKIAKLEAEAKKVDANDRNSVTTVQRKDSTLAAFIKTCQNDIAVLQKTMEDVHAKNNMATANLYFKQAETLASMAENISTTSKRKFVKREALELYKISFSLGKKDAEQKISALEREL
jgi:hypothetical protein